MNVHDSHFHLRNLKNWDSFSNRPEYLFVSVVHCTARYSKNSSREIGMLKKEEIEFCCFLFHCDCFLALASIKAFCEGKCVYVWLFFSCACVCLFLVVFLLLVFNIQLYLFLF